MNWKKTFFYAFLIFVVCLFIATAALRGWFNTRLPLRREVTFQIPTGLNGREIGRLLVDHDVIDSVESFRWAIWFKGVERDLRMGTVTLTPPVTRAELVEILRKKSPALREVTIKEGWPSWRILAEISEKLNLPKTRLETHFASRTFVNRLDLPVEARNLEGFLFPETYLISLDAAPRAVLRQMVEEFKKSIREINLRQRAREHNMTLREAVTLASIIERETTLPEERRVVSAVFHNRLRKGMRLEADPTVLFVLRDFEETLTRSDLQVNSPYNTYGSSGLPPGPICSPGAASLEAAVNPADSEALYFVSRNDGSHKFSRTLAEHRSAVKKYQ